MAQAHSVMHITIRACFLCFFYNPYMSLDIIEYTYMRIHEKYACGTDTQLPASVLENSGLATSVGSVFGKPGPHTYEV